MLQHDITNNKFYHDGLEITREEYDLLYQEWIDNLPPPAPPDPDPDIDDAEVYDILFGGGAE